MSVARVSFETILSLDLSFMLPLSRSLLSLLSRLLSFCLPSSSSTISASLNVRSRFVYRGLVAYVGSTVLGKFINVLKEGTLGTYTGRKLCLSSRAGSCLLVYRIRGQEAVLKDCKLRRSSKLLSD